LGGAAIFFAKEPSEVEIINDTNGELINFYKVLQRDFTALEKEVAISLHSRKQHRQAGVIYQNPEMFDPVKRAWAIWMLADKRAAFTIDYALRLQKVRIGCCDALRIIKSRDVPDAFFYRDPPYVGAAQGHYGGYTQEDFDTLLKLLESLSRGSSC
jgi:DNA adenine methylase